MTVTGTTGGNRDSWSTHELKHIKKPLPSALPIPLKVRKEAAAPPAPLQAQAAPGQAADLPVGGTTAECAASLRDNSTAQHTGDRQRTCCPPTSVEIRITSDEAGSAPGSRSTLKPRRKCPSGSFVDPLGAEGAKRRRKKKTITEKSYRKEKPVKIVHVATKEETSRL